MGPKRTIPAASGSAPKQQKKVMTLPEKVNMLDKVCAELSYASVGCMFGVNESTMRYIRKK